MPAPSASGPRPGGPPAPSEIGWLPDLVYAGDRFESGVAFFADALGRITRFSREPADLAAARRLSGQAALPGLVNVHSHAFHRLVRGRTEQRGRADMAPLQTWSEALQHAASGLSEEDVFDVARFSFMEMLLSGITCVGEFHYLHHRPDGTPWPDPNFLSQEIIRAAHDVGIRIALLKVACIRSDFRAAAGTAPARFGTGSADRYVGGLDALRDWVERNHPADEAWIGVAPAHLGAVPLEELKAIAAFARSRRLRMHMHVSTHVEENSACVEEYGRTPVALLAENGLLDKRFTALDAIHLTEEEVALLGAARATVGLAPLTAHNLGLGSPPVEELLAAGAGLALGTDSQVQIDLLKEARLLEYDLRTRHGRRAVMGADVAATLFQAATVTGARSLGATGGALEVGRPADFFTVNLFDPALAGANADSLLANIVFALERRAIREVWIGARQRLTNGRHALHGPIVGRFVDVQRRVWGP